MPSCICSLLLFVLLISADRYYCMMLQLHRLARLAAPLSNAQAEHLDMLNVTRLDLKLTRFRLAPPRIRRAQYPRAHAAHLNLYRTILRLELAKTRCTEFLKTHRACAMPEKLRFFLCSSHLDMSSNQNIP